MELQQYRKFPIRPAVLIATGLLSLLMFFLTSWLVARQRTGGLDGVVASYFNNPTDGGIGIMTIITFFGSSQFMVACYTVLAIFLLVQKKIFHALLTVMTAFAGYFVVYYLKKEFRRPRPYHQLVEGIVSFSFPSGHGCSGVILYGLLIYIIWHGGLSRLSKIITSIFLALFAFFIGITRVYLRVHYASDVLAGFFLGFFFLCIAVLLLSRLKEARKLEE